MIVIVSESIDQPTSQVIDWIEYFGFSWIRINFVDYFSENKFKLAIENEDITIEKFDGEKITSNLIKGVWFRRTPLIKIDTDIVKTNICLTEDQIAIRNKIFEYFSSEKLEFYNYFISKLMTHPNTIGNPNKTSLNKLIQLEQAALRGINVPKTYVSSDINFLTKKIEEKSYIQKPIKNIKTFEYQNNRYTSYTTLMVKEDLDNYEGEIPILIQEKIEKEYEVRIFILEEVLYSMAIIDSLNGIDYRQNQDSINISLYEIPDDLKNRLLSLMKYFGLNCCSIDLIKSSKDGKYYFLEINPVGQFGFLSYPCNYNIEKLIAKKLCQI